MNDDDPKTPSTPRFNFSLRSLLIGILLTGALVHINFTFPTIQVVVIDMVSLATLALWIAWKVRNIPAANQDMDESKRYLGEVAFWLPLIVAFVVLQFLMRR